MENLAPPVVAVVVTCDPGPWFEETLRSIAAQGYAELSVLVLDAASAEDPTPRVASVLPEAFVRRLPENRGFAASADAVLGMVAGASHLLLCHDDVALDPDVVHVLVEESFRSNAGVVAPKIVGWDDPNQLLHVGMAVDKGGAVVDRVEPGEVDHGQHDAVRDVFLAPGGCTLVRADLFAELGGFDPTLMAMGEDLDFCWRAQVAGARVVVAPAARVRHLERLAGGCRSLPADAPALQELQRRHELRTALVCYGRFHLARVVPQMLILAMAEIGVALVTGNRHRAGNVVRAWRWNWARRGELRAARAALRKRRRLQDSEVRRLQLRGSARLTTYLRRLFAHGLGPGPAAPDGGGDMSTPDDGSPSDDGDTSSQSPSPPDAPSAPVVPVTLTPTLSVPPRRLATWLALALILVIGTRQLLSAGFPAFAGMLPLPSWSALLHRFATGWHTTAVGGVSPVSPATGPLGLAALLLGGSSGLLAKVVVLGCIPVGAIGIVRLARPFGSVRARVTATVVYLALPVAYDAVAMGRWDALLAYAATPWIIARLARASGLEPFSSEEGGHDSPVRHRRRSLGRQVLGLAVIEALLCSLAPAGAALTLVVALGLAVGAAVSLGGRAWRPAWRILAAAAGATGLAAVLLAPWSLTLLAGPQRWEALTGLPLAPGTWPGWSSLLRLAVGPIGDTPLAYGLVVAALLPLVVAVRYRLTWAAMCWGMVGTSWLVAWAEGHGWTGGFALSPQLLLVPAAAGVSLAAGLGVVAFERDLRSYRFGWRQALAALAAVVAAVGALPVLAAAGNGRWDVPTSGYGEATAWLAARAPAGGFRVLWLADPRTLPGGGWRLDPGMAYAITDGALPDETALWAGSSPGPAAAVGHDVELAMSHDTVELGHLLATEHIRYLAVVQALAPQIPGYQSPAAYPVPDQLTSALAAQTDLTGVPGQGGLEVYVNTVAAHGPAAGHDQSSWLYRGAVLAEVVLWAVVAFVLVGRRRRPEGRPVGEQVQSAAGTAQPAVRSEDGETAAPSVLPTPAGVGR